jgi:hypothetical protein
LVGNHLKIGIRAFFSCFYFDSKRFIVLDSGLNFSSKERKTPLNNAYLAAFFFPVGGKKA